MAMDEQPPQLRILMFPWLAHGHISPFLELAKRLSSKNKNFIIYLCSTSVNLDSIKSTIHQNSSSIKLIQLHIPNSPELPPHLHTTKNLPPNLTPTLLQAFQTSSSSFSDIIDSLKPDLLIYDFFQPWAPKIASSKGVPSVHFGIYGAATLSFYYHVHTMGTSSTFPHKSIREPDHEDEINPIDRIRPYIKDADQGFAYGNFRLSTEIVLVKSCRAVEEKYINYLSLLSKKRIVHTGPLISSEKNNMEDENFSDIMEWLSEKNESSTVYISFGSECFLSKEQIAEIAKGLLLCGVNFLWVIRFPDHGGDERIATVEEDQELMFPQGFIDTVKDRGMIVTKWAPQSRILAHSSVGGFVSHCGWSSVMESMYFGVPIIAMPMKTDQPVNARLAVEAGVAVRVEKGGSGYYVAEEVAKAVNKVFVEGCLRSRAKGLSEEIREKERDEVNIVAEELLKICMKNK